MRYLFKSGEYKQPKNLKCLRFALRVLSCLGQQYFTAFYLFSAQSLFTARRKIKFCNALEWEQLYCILRVVDVNWGFDSGKYLFYRLPCDTCKTAFSTVKSLNAAGHFLNTILLFLNSSFVLDLSLPSKYLVHHASFIQAFHNMIDLTMK